LRRLSGDRVQLIGQFRGLVGVNHADDHGGHVGLLDGADHADGVLEHPRFVTEHRVGLAEHADRREHFHRRGPGH
jgi:hypothetical protein